MSNLVVTFVGIVAVALQSIRVVPQVVKGFKTRKVDDISIGWPLVGIGGAIAWIVYGVLEYDWAIILANVINISCYALILFQKKLYQK